MSEVFNNQQIDEWEDILSKELDSQTAPILTGDAKRFIATIKALQRRVEELEERLQVDHCYVYNAADPSNPTKKVLTPEERKRFPDAIVCLEADVQLKDQYIAELEGRVEWTRERPTTYGDYWFRPRKVNVAPYIVYISQKLQVYQDGDVWMTVDQVVSKYPECEWAFIPAPHEARG